ncbi:hypothetical protein [Sulfurimonas sp.]|uniref:hypothetical protein n=2 Tax=Sulfurimonas sp. TaxID=2022749 RepID=UPI003D0FE67D
MSMQVLYCHRCKTEYKVREEDINLMQEHFGNFDPKEYRDGCFFKNLGQLKRSQNQRKIDDSRCTRECV